MYAAEFFNSRRAGGGARDIRRNYIFFLLSLFDGGLLILMKLDAFGSTTSLCLAVIKFTRVYAAREKNKLFQP